MTDKLTEFEKKVREHERAKTLRDVEEALTSFDAIHALYCHLPTITTDNDAGPDDQEETDLIEAMRAALATLKDQDHVDEEPARGYAELSGDKELGELYERGRTQPQVDAEAPMTFENPGLDSAMQSGWEKAKETRDLKRLESAGEKLAVEARVRLQQVTRDDPDHPAWSGSQAKALRLWNEARNSLRPEAPPQERGKHVDEEARFSCTGSEEAYIASEREQLESEKQQIIRHGGLLRDGSAAKHRLEEINTTLKRLDEDVEECDIPPPGWRCTRAKGHIGPCAAIPVDEEATSNPLGSFSIKAEPPSLLDPRPTSNDSSTEPKEEQ